MYILQLSRSKWAYSTKRHQKAIYFFLILRMVLVFCILEVHIALSMPFVCHCPQVNFHMPQIFFSTLEIGDEMSVLLFVHKQFHRLCSH